MTCRFTRRSPFSTAATTRAKDWFSEKLGGPEAPKVRTEGYYAEMEAEKLRRMAEWRTQDAQNLPLGPERDRVLGEAGNIKNAEAEFRTRAEQGGARTDSLDVGGKLKYPEVEAKAVAENYPKAPEGHYYVDKGEGFVPRYTLKQFPGIELDTNQARQVVIKDGQPTLEARSARDTSGRLPRTILCSSGPARAPPTRTMTNWLTARHTRPGCAPCWVTRCRTTSSGTFWTA